MDPGSCSPTASSHSAYNFGNLLSDFISFMLLREIKSSPGEHNCARNIKINSNTSSLWDRGGGNLGSSQLQSIHKRRGCPKAGSNGQISSQPQRVSESGPAGLSGFAKIHDLILSVFLGRRCPDNQNSPEMKRGNFHPPKTADSLLQRFSIGDFVPFISCFGLEFYQ